ncbi:hypothetical protein LZZ85_18385 [Terrimonas sp. NA20]|uniref:Uncharacterized protein n=1 Tax=Terrimonas ginsenosidimutans TaxID=2908004 RepID=A0ABS9KVG1_9BACT|nr:hypothetical protein [Terrimonas ginsenosidimutans]MCG2616273.1 hypothetical protein [Terrimonas ginsenosidimutans]
MKYTDIKNLGFKSNEWLGSLGFYREEFEILGKCLAEVANKNTREEALKGVEHFQNQLEVQNRNIDAYIRRIKTYQHFCAEDVKAHAGKVNVSLDKDQEELERDLLFFEERIKQLREEFNLFLVKWM